MAGPALGFAQRQIFKSGGDWFLKVVCQARRAGGRQREELFGALGGD